MHAIGRLHGRPWRRRAAWWLPGALLAALVVAGCRDEEPEAELAPSRELSTVELGRLGGRIYNEPERLSEILEEVGMTPAEFEQRVRAVAADTQKAREYTIGFEAVAERPLRAADSAAPDTAVGDSAPPEPRPDTPAPRPAPAPAFPSDPQPDSTRPSPESPPPL